MWVQPHTAQWNDHVLGVIYITNLDIIDMDTSLSIQRYKLVSPVLRKSDWPRGHRQRQHQRPQVPATTITNTTIITAAVVPGILYNNSDTYLLWSMQDNLCTISRAPRYRFLGVETVVQKSKDTRKCPVSRRRSPRRVCSVWVFLSLFILDKPTKLVWFFAAGALACTMSVIFTDCDSSQRGLDAVILVVRKRSTWLKYSENTGSGKSTSLILFGTIINRYIIVRKSAANVSFYQPLRRRVLFFLGYSIFREILVNLFRLHMMWTQRNLHTENVCKYIALHNFN